MDYLRPVNVNFFTVIIKYTLLLTKKDKLYRNGNFVTSFLYAFILNGVAYRNVRRGKRIASDRVVSVACGTSKKQHTIASSKEEENFHFKL